MPSIAVSRWFLLGAFLGVGVSTVVDMVGDMGAGAAVSHLVVEGFVSAFAFLGFFVMVFQVARSLRGDLEVLDRRYRAVSAELTQAMEKLSGVADGFSASMQRQFTDWKLTAAEQDVALLILKGLSSKEIAECRQTSEKTVRLQSSAIYSKSGLASRAQLIAYFLEDLFD